MFTKIWFISTIICLIILAAIAVKANVITTPSLTESDIGFVNDLKNSSNEISTRDMLADNSKTKNPIKKDNKTFEEAEIELSKQNIKFIIDNLKYPADARKNGIQGIVLLAIEINDKGDVLDAKVEKGIGSSCDDEALRVAKLIKGITIKKAPKSGKILAKLPIHFRLD